MKKILLIIAIAFCIFQMIAMAIAIDIGITASDRDSYLVSYTIVNQGNPANESGTITSVEIYAYTTYDLVNCEVATFYVVSGDSLSTRDTHTIGAVTAGSKQTFTGLDITVESGDYIGIYFSAGRIESDTSGEVGYWRAEGDFIPCTDVGFANYAGRGISLYGTGITEEDNAIFFGTNF